MEQLERELQIMLAKLSGIGYDLFLLALIAVMALLAYRFIKWKKAEETAQIPLPTEADLRRLPNDLDKLRRQYALAGSRKKKYYLQRKICEVGMERFRRGVMKSPDALSRLMGEMYEHMFTRPEDPAFTLRCLNCYLEMAPRSMSSNPKELAAVELELAEYCSEGKYCPRDARRAREYLKKEIRRGRSSTNRTPGVYTPHMLQLMEVIGTDAFGMDFLMEQISWMYRRYSYAYHLNRKGRAAEVSCANNGDSLALYQAVKLLRQMDGAALGGDVKTMLAEYQRCADAGNAYAQYKLGQFYLTGRFVEKDRGKGLTLLKKAGGQDLDLAARLLREETTGRSGGHTMDRKLFETLAAELDEIVFLHKHAQTHRALPWGKSPEELAKAVLQEGGTFTHDLLECLSEAKCPAALRKELESYFDKRRAAAATSVEREERTSAAGGEEKGPYKGRFGVTDDEVPFNSTILPERITGPFGVVYRRIGLYTDSAEYVSDTGESTTIHLADIGFSGQSARNSDGYFYW